MGITEIVTNTSHSCRVIEALLNVQGIQYKLIIQVLPESFGGYGTSEIIRILQTTAVSP